MRDRKHGDELLCLRLVRERGIGHAVEGFSRACLLRLIDFPELPLRTNADDTIKSGRSALIVRAQLPNDGRMTTVAYKRVRRRTWVKRLSGLVRTNRTLRAWRLGHELLRRGIPTARPLAVVVPHRLDVSQASYLVIEWIDNSKNLREWCWWAAELDAISERRALDAAAVSLGKLLGRMHFQHVSHRDLKPGNLLLTADGATVNSYVIDLDGAAIHRGVSRRLRLRNLSRVVVGMCELPPIPLTVCLRFLLAYLPAAGDHRRDWKLAWRTLQRIAEVRRARKAA